MPAPPREAYEKWIDRLRAGVAIAMVCCGLGFMFAKNSSAMFYPAIGALSCVLLAIALAIEYLIRVLYFRPSRKLPWYQFSISGILILTAGVAAVCAWLKIQGAHGIWWLILAIAIFAGLLEWWLNKNNRRS